MSRLERQVELALSERIFLAAISLAYDIYNPHVIFIHPPKRPTYIDFEAARMIDYAICLDRETNELFYRRIE